MRNARNLLILQRTINAISAGVNNWEVTSSMVMMQLGDLSNLVISGLDLSGYSAYLRNVYMTGTIKQLSQDGTTEVLVPAFKGEWKAGKYWYYDEVAHNGSTWICIEPSTTQEPSDSSTDWLKVVSEGRPGDNGTSLVFKGEFASAPSNPQNRMVLPKYYRQEMLRISRWGMAFNDRRREAGSRWGRKHIRNS